MAKSFVLLLIFCAATCQSQLSTGNEDGEVIAGGGEEIVAPTSGFVTEQTIPDVNVLPTESKREPTLALQTIEPGQEQPTNQEPTSMSHTNGQGLGNFSQPINPNIESEPIFPEVSKSSTTKEVEPSMTTTLQPAQPNPETDESFPVEPITPEQTPPPPHIETSSKTEEEEEDKLKVPTTTTMQTAEPTPETDESFPVEPITPEQTPPPLPIETSSKTEEEVEEVDVPMTTTTMQTAEPTPETDESIPVEPIAPEQTPPPLPIETSSKTEEEVEEVDVPMTTTTMQTAEPTPETDESIPVEPIAPEQTPPPLLIETSSKTEEEVEEVDIPMTTSTMQTAEPTPETDESIPVEPIAPEQTPPPLLIETSSKTEEEVEEVDIPMRTSTMQTAEPTPETDESIPVEPITPEQTPPPPSIETSSKTEEEVEEVDVPMTTSTMQTAEPTPETDESIPAEPITPEQTPPPPSIETSSKTEEEVEEVDVPMTTTTMQTAEPTPETDGTIKPRQFIPEQTPSTTMEQTTTTDSTSSTAATATRSMGSPKPSPTITQKDCDCKYKCLSTKYVKSSVLREARVCRECVYMSCGPVNQTSVIPCVTQARMDCDGCKTVSTRHQRLARSCKSCLDQCSNSPKTEKPTENRFKFLIPAFKRETCKRVCQTPSMCPSSDQIINAAVATNKKCWNCLIDRCKSIDLSNRSSLAVCLKQSYFDCTYCPNWSSREQKRMRRCRSCVNSVTCPLKSDKYSCKNHCQRHKACPSTKDVIYTIESAGKSCRNCIAKICGSYGPNNRTDVADCMYKTRPTCLSCRLNYGDRYQRSMCKNCLSRCDEMQGKNMTSSSYAQTTTHSTTTTTTTESATTTSKPFISSYFSHYQNQLSSWIKYLYYLKQQQQQQQNGVPTQSYTTTTAAATTTTTTTTKSTTIKNRGNSLFDRVRYFNLHHGGGYRPTPTTNDKPSKNTNDIYGRFGNLGRPYDEPSKTTASTNYATQAPSVSDSSDNNSKGKNSTLFDRFKNLKPENFASPSENKQSSSITNLQKDSSNKSSSIKHGNRENYLPYISYQGSYSSLLHKSLRGNSNTQSGGTYPTSKPTSPTKKPNKHNSNNQFLSKYDRSRFIFSPAWYSNSRNTGSTDKDSSTSYNQKPYPSSTAQNAYRYPYGYYSSQYPWYYYNTNSYNQRGTYSNNQNNYGSLSSNQNPYGSLSSYYQYLYGSSSSNYQNPYGSLSSNQNPYDSSSSNYQNPYGSLSSYYQNLYGSSSSNYQNPYGSLSSNRNPYDSSSSDYQNPYGSLSSNRDPYDSSSSDYQNPYGSSSRSSHNSNGW